MTIEEIKSNIKWWETKRWIYNVSVGIFGIIGIYDGLSRGEYFWTIDDTIGVLVWGAIANIFYSLGFLLEVLDWYYFNSKIRIKRFRVVFFIIGILFSCLWTLWCSWIYFAKPYLW